MGEGETARSYRISVVEKAVQVLAALAEPPYRCSLSEVSARSGLSANQVFRILQTLIGSGYARLDGETKTYRLGLRIFGLVPALFNSDELIPAARDVVDAVSRETDEIVSLIALDEGDQTVCLYVRDPGDHSVIPGTIGSRSSDLHAGAVGKLFLAQRTDAEIERYARARAPLRRFTAHTPHDIETLLAAVRPVREQDCAVSIEEVANRMYGIAAPVRDRRGSVAGAITLAASIDERDPGRIDRHRESVLAAGRRISATLGYRTGVVIG